MNPQFTYDNEGNAVGVLLPIEDWNQLQQSLPATESYPNGKKKYWTSAVYCYSKIYIA